MFARDHTSWYSQLFYEVEYFRGTMLSATTVGHRIIATKQAGASPPAHSIRCALSPADAKIGLSLSHLATNYLEFPSKLLRSLSFRRNKPYLAMYSINFAFPVPCKN